jgi:hypothetical protein
MSSRLFYTFFALLFFAVPRLPAQQARSASTDYSTSAAASSIGFREVHVPADNDEWTSTGWRITSGDCVMFAADTNKIRIGPGQVVDANGNSVGTGALRAKLGTNSPITVGNRYWYCPKEQGLLKLKVADTRYDDNAGAFTVYVMRVPAQMVPSLERYQEDQ